MSSNLEFAGKIESWAKGFWRLVERNVVLVAILFFLLNLWLKGGRAGETSIFLDESASIFNGQRDIWGIINFSAHDPTPPLYYLFLGCWIKLFGIAEWSVRLPSVLFSSISAALVFLIGRRLGNNKAGLMAAIFFSFSQQQLAFAQEARAYAMGVMLVLWSSYLFLGFFEPEKQSWPRLALFTGLNIALLFSHYSMGFALLGQSAAAVWLFWRQRKAFFKVFGSYLLALAAIIPWFFYNQKLMPPGKVRSWLKPPDLEAVARVFSEIGSREWILWLMLGFMLLGLLALLGEWTKVRATLRMGKFGFFFLLSCLLLSMSAQFLVSHLVTPMFQARYLLYLGPYFYLLLAWLLALLPWRNVSQPIALLVVWLAMMFQIDRAPEKPENWKEAVALVKTWRGEHSMVIVNAYYNFKPMSYYLLPEAFKEPDSTYDILLRNAICAGKDTAMVPNLAEGKYENVILVLCGEEVTDPENQLYNYTSSKYCLIDKAHFKSIDLYQFGPKPCTKVWETVHVWDYEAPRRPGDDTLLVELPDAPSGNKVAYVGPNRDYSVAYKVPFSEIDLSKPNFLRIKAKGKYVKPESPLRLIMTMENDQESYEWQGITLDGKYPAGKWFQINEELRLPPARSPQDRLVVYFWAMKGDSAWFDDLELELSEE